MENEVLGFDKVLLLDVMSWVLSNEVWWCSLLIHPCNILKNFQQCFLFFKWSISNLSVVLGLGFSGWSNVGILWNAHKESPKPACLASDFLPKGHHNIMVWLIVWIAKPFFLSLIHESNIAFQSLSGTFSYCLSSKPSTLVKGFIGTC